MNFNQLLLHPCPAAPDLAVSERCVCQHECVTVRVWVSIGGPGASGAKPLHPPRAGPSLMLQQGFSSASVLSVEHKGKREVNPSVNTRVLNNWYFYFFPSVQWAWHATLFAQLSCLHILLPK